MSLRLQKSSPIIRRNRVFCSTCYISSKVKGNCGKSPIMLENISLSSDWSVEGKAHHVT